MTRLEIAAGVMAGAAALFALAYEASSAERLSTSQLDDVTAGAKAAVVKGIKSPAVCQCGPGAIYKPKVKK